MKRPTAPPVPVVPVAVRVEPRYLALASVAVRSPWPTSLQTSVLLVATPALKAPRLPVKKPLLAPAPLGRARVNASVALSGVLSRPKFGVVAPALLRAVTVALKALPALIGAAVIALNANDAGAAMKLSLPVITSPASLPAPV